MSADGAHPPRSRAGGGFVHRAVLFCYFHDEARTTSTALHFPALRDNDRELWFLLVIGLDIFNFTNDKKRPGI